MSGAERLPGVFLALCMAATACATLACNSPARVNTGKPSATAPSSRVLAAPSQSTASKPSQTSSTPLWPVTTVAQRAFAGEQIFVEVSNGRKIAWVLSSPEGVSEEALDFFSGDVVRARLVYSPDGHTEPEFIGKDGKRHRPADGIGFRFKDPRPGGAIPVGDPTDNGFVAFSSETLRFKDIPRGCLPDFIMVSRTRGTGVNPETLWKKVPLYREQPSAKCPQGRWNSLIGTALDLGDGTMLVTTTTRLVARLRLHDLSPAGNAPDLHILSAQAVEALISEVAAQPAETRVQYANDALRKLIQNEVRQDVAHEPSP